MKWTPLALGLVAGAWLWAARSDLGLLPLAPHIATSASVEQTDRDITRRIRKAIVADKTLSMYAHNVRILAHDGNVMLRGPVRSDDERRAIVKMASAIAGPEHVTDELTVE